jgi:hypothetical protein
MNISEAASDLMEKLAELYVQKGFPNHRAWGFSPPSEEDVPYRELAAAGYLTRLGRSWALSDAGQRWVMRNRPDLIGNAEMSDDADDFMEKVIAAYVAAGFPNHRVWGFSRGDDGIVFNELRALGIIEMIGARGSSWRLTAGGQRWVMQHRDDVA